MLQADPLRKIVERALLWEGGCHSQGWSGLAITDWLQLMPCQFIDAAQESTAAQLCPSGLKSSPLEHFGYMGGHIYDSSSIILPILSKLPLCLLILPVPRTSLLLYQIFLPPLFGALCQGVAGAWTQGCVSRDRPVCLCYPCSSAHCRPGAFSCTSPLCHCIPSSSRTACGREACATALLFL